MIPDLPTTEERTKHSAPWHPTKRRVIIAVTALVLVGVVYLIFATGLLRKETPLEALRRDEIEDFREFISRNTVPVLFGRITAIDALNNTLTVDVPEIMAVPVPPDSNMRMREVVVSFDAAIEDRFFKSEAQFQDELRKFQEESFATESSLEPPDPFVFRKLEFEDLKVGDRIMIQAAEEADIKSVRTINAARITRVY